MFSGFNTTSSIINYVKQQKPASLLPTGVIGWYTFENIKKNGTYWYAIDLSTNTYIGNIGVNNNILSVNGYSGSYLNIPSPSSNVNNSTQVPGDPNKFGIPPIKYVNNSGVTITYRFSATNVFSGTNYLELSGISVPLSDNSNFTFDLTTEPDSLYIYGEQNVSGNSYPFKLTPKIGSTVINNNHGWAYYCIVFGINSAGTIDNKSVLFFTDCSNGVVSINNINTNNMISVYASNNLTFKDGGNITSDFLTSFTTATTQFYFMNNYSNSGQSAKYDNIRIYNYAMTVTQIKTDYLL
jgi:hypothetical protein